MSPIEVLTDHQREMIDEVVAEWTAVALSASPTDRDRAEAGIYALYQRLGLPYPRKIVWCGSPLGAVITAMAVRDILHEDQGYLIGDRIKQAAYSFCRVPIQQQIGADLRSFITEQVERRVGESFVTTIRRPLDRLSTVEGGAVDDEPAWTGAEQSVRESVSRAGWDTRPADPWQSLRRHLPHYRSAVFQGQYEADWLAYFDFFREAMLLNRETHFIAPLLEIARSASWLIAASEVCWVAERHTTYRIDDRGRAHGEDGPFLAYPDGLALYAWHGVLVPGDVIENPKSITLQSIERERNVEVRRVLIERYGEERFVMDTSVVVDWDETGVLYRRRNAWMLGDEPHLIVKVLNSTPDPDGSRKPYFLRVPPDMESVRQAVAWTFGLSVDEYQPLMET